jgi:hypothetical protein
VRASSAVLIASAQKGAKSTKGENRRPFKKRADADG